MTSVDVVPEAVAAVVVELAAQGVRDVATDQVSRSMYATDASIYRVPPAVVVWPRHVDDIEATLLVARVAGVPVTMRGAGTSLAGNAIGPGIVLDSSRHLTQVSGFDADAGVVTVAPGVVHAQLQRQVASARWRYGPDPSTHSRCTIAGMVGNNACGTRALGYGRTVDTVLALRGFAGSGAAVDTRMGVPAAVAELVGANLAAIRTQCGRFARQVSGYGVEHLLPERGADFAKALVGSEGTLVALTSATVQLTRQPAQVGLVVLGFADAASAADAVPSVLVHGPVACEGIDTRIVDVVRRRKGVAAVPELPRGGGWLFVELTAGSVGELADKAQRLVRGVDCVAAKVVSDPGEAATLWAIREAGAGLAARNDRNEPAYAGWEDAAVPPALLGGYLREFDELLTAHKLHGVPYGHFGDGCLHIRITFGLTKPGGPQQYREFTEAAAGLLAKYRGSLSGEHGDGRARSDLLHHMYDDRIRGVFQQLKHHFDPQNVLNPGVIVAPDARHENLRTTALINRPIPLVVRQYREDDADLTKAVHRCTGVGACRVSGGAADRVMCPTFQATGAETHSTRGRARVLQDAVAGHLGPRGIAGDEVHAALDECLACKGCATDCPTGVDMAAYKTEALHARYVGRLRPVSHYTLGRLPQVLRVTRAVKATSMVNAALHSRVGPFLAWAAGVSPHRALPHVAAEPFTHSARRKHSSLFTTPDQVEGDGKDVVLFIDSFSNFLDPLIPWDVLTVLAHAGFRPHLVPRQGCCGLPMITTGQLNTAVKSVTTLVNQLHPYVDRGAAVVGIEPSCTAVLLDDATELTTGATADNAHRLQQATKTLAQLIATSPRFEAPDLSGKDIVAQPHCHQHATATWQPDATLLANAGAHVTRVGGCCGMAGNFGAETQHFDLSLKVAHNALAPALTANPNSLILADGYSCRTQITALGDRRAWHLATLLAGRVG